jgi:hypothetical protein
MRASCRVPDRLCDIGKLRVDHASHGGVTLRIQGSSVKSGKCSEEFMHGRCTQKLRHLHADPKNLHVSVGDSLAMG